MRGDGSVATLVSLAGLGACAAALVESGHHDLALTAAAGALLLSAAALARSRALVRTLQDDLRALRARDSEPATAAAPLHDAVTGLANRQCYQERLRAGLHTGLTPCAVLLMDLDRFKEVNDTLGHHHGDLLLREIADRLVDAAPPTATVARLGGDEFALFVLGLGTEHAHELGRQLRSAVRRPCVLGGSVVEVDASVGVAVAPMHGQDDSVLLKRADMAMYAAKAAGTGVEVYDSERDAYSPRRLALAAQLRRAIEVGELVVRYQPQVLASTGAVVAVEALARWPHPEFGLVLPGEFIPLAEQSGLIGSLTESVLQAAVRQAGEWQSMGRPLQVSVNVSMRNLLDHGVADTIAALLFRHDVPAHLLTLEITESHLMTDASRVLPVLHRLSALGVRLSIDDFGTGYSSLAYLQQLPVDEVKIDKSFVKMMTRRAADAAIVSAVVGLACSLDLDTVAEGVEDGVTAAAVTAAGCTRLQGFHVGRPMPAAAVPGWLDRRVLLPRPRTAEPRLAVLSSGRA